MADAIRVVLFSEINSKLGSPFLSVLAGHPLVKLVGLVTSRPGRLCSYFVEDEHHVDLECQAKALDVDVYRPERVSSPESVAALAALRPDYFIVANYQQILKQELLDVPGVTAINFHPSPLPRYAGLAPFYWMVRNGERYGAVSAIEMAAGIDTGPVVMQRDTPLTGQETALQLRTLQERANVRMLGELIPQLADRTFTRTEQDLSRRSYFGRPGEDDHLLDFSQNAGAVQRVVRAGYRHPGAHVVGSDGTKTVILSVAPAGGAYLPPLAAPGTVRRTDSGLFVAAGDEWLRILTVAHEGAEVPADTPVAVLSDGAVLGSGHREPAPV